MIEAINCLIEDAWMIIIFVILMIGVVIHGETEDNRLAKRVYNKTFDLPCEIEYKGYILVISREIEIFKNSYFESSYWFKEREQKRVVYFINNKAVACVTITKYLFFKHYYIEYNPDYNTSDFEKIMDIAIKACKEKQKKWHEEFLKSNKKLKIYELK